MSTTVDDAPAIGRSEQRLGRSPSGATRRFIRHYVEMVAAMLLGMAVLGSASELVLDIPDGTAATLVEMAVWMTVPMVAWMRFRGHGWRACTEMVGVMLLPTAGALALLATGVVTDVDALMMFEHSVMFPAMLVAMLLRRDESAGHDGHALADAPAPA